MTGLDNISRNARKSVFEVSHPVCCTVSEESKNLEIFCISTIVLPCSENKGTDQLRSYCNADLRLCFRIGKNLFFSIQGLYIYVILFLDGFTIA